MNRHGAVLLEVLLALILFVGAAAVISSSLSASVASVERMEQTAHAANLAVTVMSEIQLDMHPMQPMGPIPFEPPFEKWTYEIVTPSPQMDEQPAFKTQKVEVIIRHTEAPYVHRLTQVLPSRRYDDLAF